LLNFLLVKLAMHPFLTAINSNSHGAASNTAYAISAPNFRLVFILFLNQRLKALTNRCLRSERKVRLKSVKKINTSM
jgi:hypothetical protein